MLDQANPQVFLDGRVALHCGDVRERLAALPSDHFDCVVTSPPYWGLRDYGVDGQLGMEESLGEHVETMVGVFREVRRVLRPEGTLWLNYGDSYAASPNGRSAADVKVLGNDDRTFRDKPFSTIGPIHRGKREGNRWGGGNNWDAALKPKDLCGIPWRVAFGLQADGWWLRQDIIWSKPNPMPESIKDRCTKAHEYIFLLSKRQRYYFDHDSIKEPATDIGRQNGREGREEDSRARPPGSNPRALARLDYSKLGRTKRSVWEVPTAPYADAHFATFPPALIEPCIKAGCPTEGVVLDPFGGAGTTGLVAASLGRRATLIELNPEYCRLARTRIEAAFMGKEEGARHMAKQLGKTSEPGPLFAALQERANA